MAKSSGQKSKLLHLRDIFHEKTDEEHPLSISEIIVLLNQRGISVERKTLYDDFDALTNYGFRIETTLGGRKYYTSIRERDFELVELKLLIDAVQASKFIPEKKSRELIAKIEKLCNEHEARQLHRDVILANRVKSMNGSVFYNVDALQNAITAQRQISFRYSRYTVEKTLVKNRKRYTQSPFSLIYADEQYYLLSYDVKSNSMRHFRVDKMSEIQIHPQKPCVGKEAFEKLDMATYTQHTFAMYGGHMERVEMIFKNDLAGVVIDRFGQNVFITPVNDDHFKITVNVTVSNQFFGWVFGLGRGVKILSPQSVVEDMRKSARLVLARYPKNKRRKPDAFFNSTNS